MSAAVCAHWTVTGRRADYYRSPTPPKKSTLIGLVTCNFDILTSKVTCKLLFSWPTITPIFEIRRPIGVRLKILNGPIYHTHTSPKQYLLAGKAWRAGNKTCYKDDFIQRVLLTDMTLLEFQVCNIK